MILSFLTLPVIKTTTLELAIRANSKYIETYNKPDFEGVKEFGIEMVTPREYLKIIEVYDRL